MLKESLIMTVSDREPELLLNTMRWLLMSDLSDSEIIIVDDCSKEPLEDYLGDAVAEVPVRIVRMDPYECSKIGDNFNNPAKAFNRGLAEAKGQNIGILSSDVLLPPRVLTAARKHDTSKSVFCPMVIDLATSMEYCGPHRMFPMPWFLYAKREHIVEAGGWDENYLMGMCFEDNDFVGRLALVTGCIVGVWEQIVWHQSHHQPAYEMDNSWVKLANDRNRVYTADKWTGMPFGDSDQVAFEIVRGRDDNGHFAMTFNDIKGIKERVINKTLSPFVEQEEDVAV